MYVYSPLIFYTLILRKLNTMQIKLVSIIAKLSFQLNFKCETAFLGEAEISTNHLSITDV